jgi:hypothetical protein
MVLEDTNVTEKSDVNRVFMDRRAFRRQLRTKTSTNHYHCGSTGGQP